MKTSQNFFSRTMLVVGLICWLCFFLPEVKAQSESDWFIVEANEYIKECSLDTIKAKRPQALQTGEEFDYVIEHNNFGEWVSEKQLEDRGYKYRYRWVIKTDPFEFEYIFIREPTFKGFIEWWELKGKK